MNNDYRCNFIFVLCISALVSGCVGDLIWNNDERYMYRGALDSGLPEIYNTYQFNFLRTYRVTHQWPREADFCGAYRKHPTLGVQDGKSGEFFNVSEIYEDGGKTWQGSSIGKPPADFDYAVRSIKRMYPEYAVETDRAGNRYKTDKVIGMKEKEVGRGSICNYVWSGLDQALMLEIFKQSQEDYIRSFETRPGIVVKEKVGQNEWWSKRTPYNPATKALGSELWVTKLGNSDYILIITWAHGERSENRPEINAKFQAALRHLLESVRIESLK
ncbi:hypothetical protein [Azospira sp. I09]|jgi:hypothetical protein|uniref:hypothetical protein n=1 Tax=Azospira sp. I09 TaxID=1765049 RepID=UPI001260EBBB|nr:hypothetical protein [Azospira sp. I09]BBN87839.1 hypothetical protein AZSP09_08620 [Azospira sp. I09]